MSKGSGKEKINVFVLRMLENRIYIMNNYNKMSKIIGDDLVFSTGKKIYCNGGCISLWISPQNNCAGISYGADGGIDLEDLEEEEIDELVAMVISDEIGRASCRERV